MLSTVVKPSLKIYLSSIVTFIFSIVCLLMPADPGNVSLTVTGYGQGTYEDFDTPYCYVSVKMENKTFRTLCKPDYAVLEKEADGEWINMGKGYIPQEDYWTVLHSGDVTEAFYFSLENESDFSPGEYRITVYYSIQSLSEKGESNTVFIVS